MNYALGDGFKFVIEIVRSIIIMQVKVMLHGVLNTKLSN